MVPANDEAELIGACLDAVVGAAGSTALPVIVCVVLDDCRDATANRVAGRVAGTTTPIFTVTIGQRSVGAARRAGTAALLARLGTQGTWLATTDADSQVPRCWLNRQMDHARGGMHAVVGSVAVADWAERPAQLRTVAERHYQRSGRHIHGANLGVGAQAYLDVGGFAPVRCHEDVTLVRALAIGGHRVGWDTDLVVTTSARTAGRAPAGFSGFLNDLELAIPVAP